MKRRRTKIEDGRIGEKEENQEGAGDTQRRKVTFYVPCISCTVQKTITPQTLTSF
jgi:hypothetical protein